MLLILPRFVVVAVAAVGVVAAALLEAAGTSESSAGQYVGRAGLMSRGVGVVEREGVRWMAAGVAAAATHTPHFAYYSCPPLPAANSHFDFVLFAFFFRSFSPSLSFFLFFFLAAQIFRAFCRLLLALFFGCCFCRVFWAPAETKGAHIKL